MLAQTEERGREIGLATTMLPVWYDVDDIDSLRRLHGQLRQETNSAAIYAARHSSAFLQSLFRERA